MKDSKPRGIKLFISRVIVGRSFEMGQPLHGTGCSMHLLDLDRKNDRKGKAVASVVENNRKHILEVALSDDERPPFQDLCDELSAEIRRDMDTKHVAKVT
jgi:hypothetical protein